jgi:hypothetical protein
MIEVSGTVDNTMDLDGPPADNVKNKVRFN